MNFNIPNNPKVYIGLALVVVCLAVLFGMDGMDRLVEILLGALVATGAGIAALSQPRKDGE